MIRINFGGDIMLGRGIGKALNERGAKAVFDQIRSYFPSDEYNVCNLEAPFISNGEPYWKKDHNITFGIDELKVSALKQINIKAAILGNNHIADYGLEGISQSIEVLNKMGIKYTGAGLDIEEATTPIVVIEEGVEIAIFSFCAFPINAKSASRKTWGMAYFDYQTVKKAILKCSSQSKVILNIHWGIDYYQYPVKAQLDIAKKLIDDFGQIVCIIGHHPHVIQPVLDYKQSRIFLSLGNLAFDEPKALSRMGMVVKIIIDRQSQISYETSFVSLAQDNVLIPLDEKEKQQEITRLKYIESGVLNQTKDYLDVDERWALSLLYSALENWQVKNLYKVISLYGWIRIFKVILHKFMENKKQ